jgi:hypothetical protein
MPNLTPPGRQSERGEAQAIGQNASCTTFQSDSVARAVPAQK